MKNIKKIFILLLLLLTCGCTVVRINTDSIDTIIEVILSKNIDLFNRTGRGYKYYVPKGVAYIDTDGTNDKLYSNGYYYYLYVDTVSYSQNIKVEYEENKNAYYSRKLNKDEGFKHDGYLEVIKEGNLYHITFEYNHAKIETMVSKKEINVSVLNIAYILSTIQYNDDIISLTIDEETYNREEKYEVFKNKEEKDINELQIDE